MPTVNIFYKGSEKEQILKTLIYRLKDFIAKKLTCGDIKLKADEVSIRLIQVNNSGMISSIEIEVTAHAFLERIKKQDEICLKIMDYVQKQAPSLGDVKVWLQLSELGHSWKG